MKTKRTTRQQQIELLLIQPPVFPLRPLDETNVANIMKSAGIHGILQPILVMCHDDKYWLISGNHRVEASRRLGLKDIPANIVDGPLTPGEQHLLSLAESIQGQDLNAVDEANALNFQIQEQGLSPSKLAESLGIDLSYITRRLDLIRSLVPQVLEMIRTKKLPFTSGFNIARHLRRHPQEQLALAQRAVDFQMTSTQVIAECMAIIKQGRKAKPKKVKVKTKSGLCAELPATNPEGLIEELTALIAAIRKAIKDCLPLSVVQNLLNKPE